MALKNTNGRILMSYCPDIRILDCTLRDGGLVNNFAFPDEFVKALYQANIASGVDYMEFGYKASKRLFSTEEFGNGSSVTRHPSAGSWERMTVP